MSNPHNMPPAKAAHLAGLEYAYRLWHQIEENNDVATGHDEWLSTSEQFEMAIAQARKDAKSAVSIVGSTAPPQLIGAAVFTPSGVIVRRLVDSDVSTMARTMSNRNADACNVDREDYWKQYGQDCIEDVQAMVDSVRT